MDYVLQLFISFTLLGSYLALDRYPENLVIVKRTESTRINCGEGQFTTVTWKRNDEVSGNSKELALENVDQPLAGNYTCWQNGSLVYHKYLVISEEDQSPIFQSKQVQCQTRSFTGVITCSWKTRGAAFYQVRYCRRNSTLNPECTYNYLNYSSSGTDHHFTFTEENYSPYAEEYRPITFIVEAVNSVSYQSLQKTFYVGDIVKPDPPQLQSAVLLGRNLSISWQYPSNWVKPYSYFPLIFQVQCEPVRRCRAKKCKDVPTEIMLPQIIIPNRCKIHIRAKDKFLNSPWSDWSDWVDSKSQNSMAVNRQGTR
ncbi:interleukin-12 subunit beta-like [Hemitrygon akajei]|uniref:interleukin-12 subunit beta-like n=1 Tax=Hemitrygon akajei TaxID=2704970 RepID=UPI003BF953C3